MDVKKAVAIAKGFVSELFSDEGVQYIGLEEVEFDERQGQWNITVGFSRPWDEPRNSFAAIAGDLKVKRSYKVVRIDDTDQKVVSVKSFQDVN